MSYKTLDDAIAAAKLELEAGAENISLVDSPDDKQDSGHDVYSEKCWCGPRRIDTPHGTIWVHQSVQ